MKDRHYQRVVTHKIDAAVRATFGAPVRMYLPPATVEGNFGGDDV